MPETGHELRVGTVMLIALVALGALVVARDPNAIRDAAVFHVRFKRPAALREGAMVRLSGQVIGVVKAIRLDPASRKRSGKVDPTIIVDARIRKSHADRVRTKSLFYVETAGVLGEAYLELDPGPPENPPVPPGSTLDGIDPPTIDVMMEQTYKSLRAGAAFLADQGPVLRTIVETGGRITRTLDEIDPGLARTKRIRASVDRMVIDGAAVGLTLNRATDGGRRLARLQPAARDLFRKAAEVISRERVRLTRALEELDAAMKLLGPGERRRMTALANEMLGTERKRLEKILADTRKIFKDIEGGRGTLGALWADNELFDELKVVTKTLKQAPWKVIGRPPGAAGKGP